MSLQVAKKPAHNLQLKPKPPVRQPQPSRPVVDDHEEGIGTAEGLFLMFGALLLGLILLTAFLGNRAVHQSEVNGIHAKLERVYIASKQVQPQSDARLSRFFKARNVRASVVDKHIILLQDTSFGKTVKLSATVGQAKPKFLLASSP